MKDISNKLIQKITKGDTDFNGYNKLFDDYKLEINCKAHDCNNFSFFKKILKFILNDYKQKDDFYAELIHDIKSPLYSIALALKNGSKNIQKDIYKTNFNVLELIDSALIWHSEKNLPVQGELVDPFEILNKVLENLKFIIQDKEIKIQTIVETKFEAHASYLCIERIFSNLISNAIKFSPRAGTVNITFKKEKGKHLAIFENKITRFKKEKSTGLGLKIAQDMACLVGAKLIQKKQNNLMKFTIVFPNKS